jgi:ABC-2 type transport system permease protein
VAPIAVESVALGQVPGRTADDETATYILSLVLFLSVSVYGAMVLSGVVEERSSRVVEVLLARIPARSLLAGKVAGIGLLGLAQVVVTGLVAVAAVAVSDVADVPAASTSVIAWAVAWFVIGYALIATAYGVLGSLASRSEDASSVTGPISVLLIGAYFVSFAAVGSPDALWAKLASWFPVTAPFAMPNRIAMGATAWWEPIGAAVLALAALGGLVVIGGRVYTHAVLHTGGIVRFADAWRGAGSSTPPQGPRTRSATLLLVGTAAAVGAGVVAVSHDVVLAVTVAAILAAVGSRTLRARRGSTPVRSGRRNSGPGGRGEASGGMY